MNTPVKKIPCSVSMLTLNSAEGLRACLESLKDFAEIIVCDGNSTDTTRDIAEGFGARVIKQYDTDESETPCAMDKAGVRARAMQASTLPWRFFMDSDDTLSPEAVDEIRGIVSDPNPKHFVWRMPTRIFIDEKEIKHEATYPSYQTRLVHESVQARFRGPVHERLVFNEKKFPVGTMKSFYNFHWPQERVQNFWLYQRAYVRRELAVAEFPNTLHFLRWGLWYRLKIIFGYILWRLPVMYLRRGFRGSMPLWIELEIVGYHCLLLLGSIGKFITTRRLWIMGRELLRGRSLSQSREATKARFWEAYGKTLLVGTGEQRSRLWPYVRKTRWHKLIEMSPEEYISLGERQRDFDTILVCSSSLHKAH